MKELQSGDILFHYNSTRGAVLGISRVIDIGQHKGGASRTACVIPGTQCIQYTGRHLSEDDFSVTEREHYRRLYSSYLEVHTAALSTWSSLCKKLGSRDMVSVLIGGALWWLFLGSARMLLIFRQVYRGCQLTQRACELLV